MNLLPKLFHTRHAKTMYTETVTRQYSELTAET